VSAAAADLPRDATRGAVPKSQRKLVAALVGLVLFLVAVTGVLVERGLRSEQVARVRRELEQEARAVAIQARDLRFEPASRPAFDALADQLAAATSARVTWIARDGAVLGDSEAQIEKLSDLGDHAQRPEIREAFAGRTGSARRRSASVGRELFYVAVPVGDDARAVVRLAVDATQLDPDLGPLTANLLLATAIGLAAAGLLAVGLSGSTLRPIREMRRMASAIAAGDLGYRLPLRFGDELGEIATALQRMADQLRERAETATREKDQLQAVLNGMVEGVLVVDPEQRILLGNQRLREFFGITSEVRGRTPLESIRHAQLAEVLKAADNTDEPVSHAIEVAHPAHRTLRVHAVRFPPGRAARAGTVAVFHDVTELMQLEKMRRDFVANASHELRTPLAAIHGFAETLLANRSLGDSDRRAYLEVIDRHSKRLSTIVGDLLDLSRIEGREASFELAAIDTVKLADTLLRDWRPRIEEKRLNVSLESERPGIAWADPQACEQILSNLLDNAIKYTEPGGKIELRIGGDDRCVRIDVKDTGIGIPERDLARIFERFYRVDKARSRSAGGTGLGLAIVKHLVQGLGGTIQVESQLGRGSTFSFTLPRHAS
jgi:two-component system phosphate regulon sensor histidine kinase PhoR